MGKCSPLNISELNLVMIKDGDHSKRSQQVTFHRLHALLRRSTNVKSRSSVKICFFITSSSLFVAFPFKFDTRMLNFRERTLHPFAKKQYICFASH